MAKHCGPCEKIKELFKAGRINRKDVELIDLETDEGFRLIEAIGVDAVPSVYKGKEKCLLQLDEDKQSLIITCPTENISEESLTPST